MGDVDFLDTLIGLYRCHIRSKKWYMHIFVHLMDLTFVNSWLLYRRQKATANSSTSKPLKLHDFKPCVAEALCSTGKIMGTSTKRGRRSELNDVDVTIPNT